MDVYCESPVGGRRGERFLAERMVCAKVQRQEAGCLWGAESQPGWRRVLEAERRGIGVGRVPVGVDLVSGPGRLSGFKVGVT